MQLLAVAGLLAALSSALETGNHPNWPRWCGKAYEPQYPSFNPGGQLYEPAELANGPALFVQFKPRYNIYLSSESTGEFVVRNQISEWFGSYWPNLTTPSTAPVVQFTINLASDNSVLVANNFTVSNSSSPSSPAEESFEFSFKGLEPRFESYQATLFGATEDGLHNFTVDGEFTLLPEKTNGSVTKIDNVNGGMLFRNNGTGGEFVPLISYGFYASCDGFLCENNSISAIQQYYDLGLTGMVPLTPVYDSRDDFDFMDSLDLKFMYDLREYYQNLTSVREQVSMIKDFSALYAYWEADEPDGNQDPFNATVIAQSTIRSIDPYHPVAVVLNCHNYYFEKYTAGADLIMEDVYPIGVNHTFSKWGTPCNATYGDCGCDMCDGNVQDVPSRLDTLAQYEEWLGLWPKMKVHNPQSFDGEGYWARDPTVEEEVAMVALAFNHGAKGMFSWVWPTTTALAQIHGQFAKVTTQSPVVDFIVPTRAAKVTVPSMDIVDVAYWVSGDEVLVSVVNGGYDAINQAVTISLPSSMTLASVNSVAWGNATWSVSGSDVKFASLDAMSTNMAIIKLL